MLLNPFCDCGSHMPHAVCCQPYLSGAAPAPTAEALMRSRYTAYSQGHSDYLIKTWQPPAGPLPDQMSLRQSLQQTQWLGLTIIKTQKGQAQDRRGVVEFVAQYKSLAQLPSATLRGGKVKQLHERSRFVQTAGQWFYVDGDQLPPINLAVIAHCRPGSNS